MNLVRPASRIATGSTILARGIATRAAAWVARGRRHDLTGWQAALGCWLRIAVLGLSAYLLYRLLRAVPHLMWLLSAGWLLAAWRTGQTPAADEPAEEPEEETPAAPDVDAVRTLLLEAMGDHSAVHLNTVLTHLQKEGHGAGWTVADLRARLEALHIPTHPKVKAPGSKSPTRGVRRADLVPSPAPAQETPTAVSTAV